MIKKSYHKIILACLIYIICILYTTVIYAQNVKIKGLVVDSLTSAPLATSIISLITKDGQKEIFNGLVTNQNGSFEFRNISTKGEKCIVKVKYMGYKDKYMLFSEDLGVIRLEYNNINLEEVTIIGKIAIRQDVDRSCYLADSLNFNKISTTTDLLRQIPEIAIDELLRKASIKGKKKTLVMQNGINTGLSVDLRTIDFRNIARIEVITSPSSGTENEYDGIINIIMKQKVSTGFALDIEQTTMINFNSNDTYLGLSLNKNKVSMKLSYSNYYRANPFTISKLRSGNNNIYAQDGYASNPFERTNDFGLNIDYHISPNDFFNLTTSTKLVRADKRITYKTSNVRDFALNFESDYFIGNYTLYYRHTMKNKHMDYLSVNANIAYMNASECSDSKYDNGLRFINDETGNKFSSHLRVEYNNQLSSKFRLNTGVQLFYQDFYSILNSASSDNNHHNLRGNIYADIYASLGSWQFRAGVKEEMNLNNFSNELYRTTSQFLFQPIVTAMYKINKNHSFSIEYRRPSRYPSAWMLSPYVIQIDEKSTQIGNPKLLLTSNDIIDLNYTLRSNMMTLKIGPFFQYSSNVIIPQTTFDQSLNSTMKFVNGGSMNRFGVLLNGALNFLQGAISIEPDMYIGYDHTISTNLTQNNLSYRLGGAVNLYLPFGFGIGAYGTYRNKYLTINGYSEPRYSLDAIYLLKRFDKIGLNLFVGYQNLVQSADVDYTISNDYYERNYFKFNSKGFILRLNYYFQSGKTKSMEHINTYFDSDRK